MEVSRARTIAVERQWVSTSLLQRSMGVGHARAVAILDALERDGVIAPYAMTSARDVLIPRDAGSETESTSSAAPSDEAADRGSDG